MPKKEKEKSIPDSRFASAEWDPRFSRVPRTARHATPDRRFRNQLLSNPAFRTSQTPVDRFGKRKKSTLTPHLQQLVRAPDPDDEEPTAPITAIPQVGYASSSSDSDSESDIEPAPEEEENIPRGRATDRLAVMGLDWTTVRAVDIFASLACFCPAGKGIEYVEVHPSKFGMERLAQEARFGPQVVRKEDLQVAKQAERELGNGVKEEEEKSEDSEDSGESEDSEDSEDSDEEDVDEDARIRKQQAALRKYEEERLRYYYAVVKFADVSSADAVYTECDGVEFSQSGLELDLRFIPSDMEISTTARDRADKVADGYRPPTINPSSLNNSTVKLSWDADDPQRMVLKKRREKEVDRVEQDLRAYLASSSEDEVDEGKRREIEKKRSLLLAGSSDDSDKESGKEDKGEDEDKEGGMEISFEPGLLEKGEEIVRRKAERDGRHGESEWEGRMRRMKERKAEKKQKWKESKRDRDGRREERGEEEEAVQNGDDGLGFDDPFFQSEGAEKKKKKSKSRKSSDDNYVKCNGALEEGERERERERAELELLTMSTKGGRRDDSDDESGGRKRTRGKRRGQKHAIETSNEEKSGLDVQDERFQRVFSSHLFAMDPSHPKYKRSEATQRIVKEKMKRQHAQWERTENAGMDEKLGGHEKGKEGGMKRKSAGSEANNELRALAARLKRRKKSVRR